MKVVVCSNAFLPAELEGGPPFSTYNLCRALSQEGAEVSVVATNRNGTAHLPVATDGWSGFEGLPVWYAKAGRDSYYFAPSAARALASIGASADVIINSGTLWTHLGFLAWRAGRRRGIPSITYVRGLLDPWARAYRRHRKRLYWRLLGERLLRDTAAIVALTHAEKTEVEATGVKTRVEVIPNGVDVAEHARPAERRLLVDLSRALGERRYLLFLGRVHPIKGIDILVRSFAEIAREMPDVDLAIAGPVDPRFETRFQQLLDSSGMRARVALTGPVAGRVKHALLQHAEALVLPSYSEGLSMAALEALASRCPVILSRRCNLPQVALHRAGLEIDPDEGQLRDALHRLLSDDSLRAELAENAYRLACQHFDWRVVGKRVLELCASV
jgi:glycosyltransferase involved in cell wall biosynthesis